MRQKRHYVGWKYQVGSPSSRYHEADTLAAAIRDAGIRCETCKHWDEETGVCETLTTEMVKWPIDLATRPDFFCADHSKLTEDSR